MIELTLEQARALQQENGSPSVFDPTTNTAYTLVPIEAPANGSTAVVWESVETPVESWITSSDETIRGVSNSTSKAGT